MAEHMDNGDAPIPRTEPRVRLVIEAVLMGMEGRQQVILFDLSRAGAKVEFEAPPAEKAGFLSWMEFETFGDVVWREGLYVGLKFDKPIPVQWLDDTCDRVGDGDAYRHEELLKQAREWVEG